ncbi:ATP-grasp domain-containing protein [Myxococcota bacterium]|nr:ATP-grasp domain-containing protein [Myxococcota bacterium]
MSRVLVTDGEQRASLAVTRSLGAAGHEVHVLAYRPKTLAGASRWAADQHIVPDAFVHPTNFVEAVREISRDFGIDFVFPMTDQACVSLLPVRDELENAQLVAPSLETYSQLSDKGRVIEMAIRHGFKIPDGARVGSWAEAKRWSEKGPWPLVLKPTRSVRPTSNGGAVQSPPVKIVETLEELHHAWGKMDGADALLQNYVDGWGEGIFVLRARGQTWASFAHRRVREKPPGGGVSVLREAIPVNSQALRRLESLLDEAGFEGIAMAEFKTNGQEQWLMEFNVRFWGSLQLAIDAGVDFPALAVRAFGKQTGVFQEAPTYRPGVRSRWLIGDLDHALALARGRSDTHGRRGICAALRVLFSPAGPMCHWEVLRTSDPRPFWVEIKQWLATALRPRTGPS